MSLGHATIRALALALVIATANIAPAQSAGGDFAGLVDIGGGRKMYLACRGTRSPTVILVAGLKGSADDWMMAAAGAPNVFSGVVTRVCATTGPERRSGINRAAATR